MDARKGLYSYSALQSRLAENTFAKNGYVDYNHPILRLSSLSQEEFLVLLGKLQHVFAYGDPDKYLLPSEGLVAFMDYCNKRIGDYYFRTPRTTITAFINLLSVLEQNSEADWKEILQQITVDRDMGFQNDTFTEHIETDQKIAHEIMGADVDEFASFKL